MKEYFEYVIAWIIIIFVLCIVFLLPIIAAIIWQWWLIFALLFTAPALFMYMRRETDKQEKSIEESKLD